MYIYISPGHFSDTILGVLSIFGITLCILYIFINAIVRFMDYMDYLYCSSIAHINADVPTRSSFINTSLWSIQYIIDIGY